MHMRDILRYGDHTYRLRQRLAQPLCEEFDVSCKEIDILSFLCNNPELNTARDITEHLKIAKSNLSPLLVHLEKAGWLRAEPEQGNRRLKRLILLRERGKELARLTEYQESFMDIFTRGFTDKELETMHILLERMDANVLKALAELEEKKHA
ncbi:MAG: MarR family transcriptional regulator [Oscillospiraceae bacterium]|nr:MarR family transcriptional regulator [Oscillospiraceae bacterium]